MPFLRRFRVRPARTTCAGCGRGSAGRGERGRRDHDGRVLDDQGLSNAAVRMRFRVTIGIPVQEPFTAWLLVPWMISVKSGTSCPPDGTSHRLRIKSVKGCGCCVDNPLGRAVSWRSSSRGDRGMTHLLDLKLRGARVEELTPIAHLTGLSNLELQGTRITDAGLAPVAGFTGLKSLNLGHTPIADAGLKHLRNLTRLNHLDLEGTHITDAGLSRLAGVTSLMVLYLNNTGVTDRGLAHLDGLVSLTRLGLASTKVTDAGLVDRAKTPSLAHVNLYKTDVTDTGLKHLAGLRSLATLNIAETRVTDAGLRQLVQMKRLTGLVIDGNQATTPAIRGAAEIPAPVANSSLARWRAEWLRLHP